MTHKTHSFSFWVLFAVLSTCSGFLALHLFPKAFPIVSLELSMNRVQALEAARNVVEKFNLGPTNADQSASFVTDTIVKTFVELECGGPERFTELVKEKLYYPYTWHVRHFKPYNPHEVLLKYTPDGTLYGFIEILPEDHKGASIGSAHAQKLAEHFIEYDWASNLSEYRLIESSQETVSSGRTDHTFVYERTDKTIGEGFYRLTITVSGDKITQINPSIEVPDSFMRRYQEMRTANDTIARIAQLLILLLYLLGGVIGLISFMRYKLIIWKPAILSGLFIAMLHFLVKINSLPLAWMHYQTSLSPLNFILQLITYGVYQLIYTTLLYGIIFAIAETFTRSAFGSHPQFWQLWTSHTASSTRLARATITGYLAVPFLVLYVVLFYIVAHNQFHWWIPSQAFFEPDVLATYIPSLSSLSQALGAGFMEECLFRAIPIAGALLLARKYGHQQLLLITAFIIQSLIFGAAHANYPMQPAYARLIELIIPSCGFGALYYFAGLFPAIIAHVVYDIVWMALPIFMNHSPLAWIHKMIVIIIGLIPIWFLVYARLKKGSWTQLPIIAHNEYWRPTTPTTDIGTLPIITERITIKKVPLYIIYILSVLGIIGWAYSITLRSNTKAISITRSDALDSTTSYFTMRNIDFINGAQRLTYIEESDVSSPQHAFVWQTGGKQIYEQLLGNYLAQPHWVVRVAKFEGDIIARAEEYKLHLDNSAQIIRMQHQLPESQPGNSLSQAEARRIAHTAIHSQYTIDPGELTEISAQEIKRPARKDWVFTFSDQAHYPLATGQARIAVEIAGSEVVDMYRYIFVPQEWRRSYENQTMVATIIKQLSGLCIYLIFISAALGSVWYLTHLQVAHTMPMIALIFFILLFLLSLLNGLPKVTYFFNTCRSWNNQLFTTLAMFMISASVKASALAGSYSTIGMIKAYWYIGNNHYTRIVVASGIGAIFASYVAIIEKMIPAQLPRWQSFAYLNSYLSYPEYITTQLVGYISFTILVILIFVLTQYIVRSHRYRKIVAYAFLIVCSFIFTGAYYAHTIPLLITLAVGISILLILFFELILKFDYALIPLTTGSYTLLTLLHEQFTQRPVPYTLPLYSTILLIVCMSLLWYLALNKQCKKS